MTNDEALAYGLRVARCIWRDSDAESVASEAVNNALNTFNAERGTLPRWIALHVRQAIWDEWRKLRDRHSQFASDGWWEAIYTLDDPVSDAPRVCDADWQLLVEYYVDKWPLDVVAREHGVSTYRVRRMIAAATERFLESQR